jgi:hypothetical protein
MPGLNEYPNAVCLPAMRKGFVFCLFIFSIIVFWFSFSTGCANIIPPAGGPRDSIPPRLVKADPPDSSVNFRSKKIVLTFDELVDLKDVANNLIFTPTFENNPIITVKGRTITIPFKDSLERNTTYVLNFGNAIVDIDESNVLKDFTYTFSTGPALDSLEINGKVILAETGEIDTTLVAILHKKLNDSAVVNQRPMYAVRLDSRGEFHFKNLPRDTFALYVLGDAGMARRYQSKTQLFAFADSVVVAGQADSLLLYAYRETPPVSNTQAVTTRIPVGDRRLRFTQTSGSSQDLKSDYILGFPVPLRTFDSSKIHLTTDSSFSPAVYSVSLDSTRKELRIKSQWKEDTKYNLALEKDFASDTSGRQLFKSDTLFFMTKKAADYGKVTLRFRNLDTSKHPVLQFVQNGVVVLSAPLASAVFSKDAFNPGDYDLHILFDRNKNGKWDPGKFFEGRKQPEIVISVPQKITVKADQEVDKEILL